MNIKRKLIIISLLIGFVLIFIMGIIISNSLKNIQQIKIIGTNIDNINAIVIIRSSVNKQMQEIMEFIISGEEKHEKEFEEAGIEIKATLEQWINAEKNSRGVGAEDKGEHLKKATELRDRYNEYMAMVTRSFELVKGDKETLRVIGENLHTWVEPWIEYILLEEIDDVMYDEIKEIDKSYNRLLLNIGTIPWVAKRSISKINIAHKATRDYLSIDNALYNINRQIKEAEGYIVSGEIENRKNFDEYGINVKRALKEWTKSTQIHKLKMEDGLPERGSEERDWETATDLANRYHQILDLLERGMELRGESERGEEAFNYIQEYIIPAIENVWTPTINNIINDNKKKINDAHNNLLDLLFYAEIEITAILGTLFLTIILLLFNITKKIIVSLNNLKIGTEVLASGNLNHRIDLISRDELGDLALSFNKMAIDLQRSREELIKKHEELDTLFTLVARGKKEWEETMDCIGDMVIITDSEGKIKRCNKSFMKFMGKAYQEILSKDWKELLYKGETEIRISDENGTEIFHKPTGRWFVLNSYPFQEKSGEVISVTVITIHDYTKIKTITSELEEKNLELKNTQSKVLQQEKMASIGQLAAGVAHEINNPIGFISSNLGTLDKYIQRLTEFIMNQSEIIGSIKDPAVVEELKERRKKLKLDYILEDIKGLINESLDGTNRVRKIVQDLKTFSRVDESEYKHADINECIETTINIIWNELKYKTTLKKEYGDIPHTKCYPQQLNQVFMNIMVNAAHAIEKRGEIGIKTWHMDGSIFISISDTGSGISKENLNRIFEPFFTTKEVGKGTGLGLSITYDIVKKHKGEITVDSEVGKGTTFTIRIPIVEER